MNGLLLALLLLQVPATLQNQNGSLIGRVQRMDDQPAVGVRIAALAVPDPNSRNIPDILASISETDGEGRYRLDNIPPGRYYVIAGLVDLPTYYPGAMEISGARVVEVTARGLVEGIDFKMQRPATLKLTRLLPAPDDFDPLEFTER